MVFILHYLAIVILTASAVFAQEFEQVNTTSPQTLENKTLTSPSISAPYISGTVTGTPTIPGAILPNPTITGTVSGGPTIPGPTITSPTITGTVSGGPTIPGPTITSPTITGTVPGAATYTSPTLNSPVLNTPTVGKLVEGSLPAAVAEGKVIWLDDGPQGLIGDFGTKLAHLFGYNWVADSYTTLNAAAAAIGGTTATIVFGKTVTVNQNLTIGRNIILVRTGQGLLSPDTGINLAIYSPEHLIAPPREAAFGGLGTVTFTNPGRVYPGWKSAKGDDSTDDTAAFVWALNSASGNEVIVPAATYKVCLVTLNNPVSIVGSGKVTLHLVGSGCRLRVDTSLSRIILRDFIVEGSGVAGDDHYGFASQGSNIIMQEVFVENVTARNVVNGFDLTTAKKVTMIAPRVETTVGDLTGQGYGIITGNGALSAITAQDVYIVAPYLYRTTRHAIYNGGATRFHVANPVIHEHRNGLSGNLERAALALSRGTNMVVDNPQFIGCAGAVIYIDDTTDVVGGARNIQVNGGFSVSPQQDGGNVVITGSNSADSNTSQVRINNFHLEINPNLSASWKDLWIVGGADIYINGFTFDADKSLTSNRALIYLQEDVGTYIGNVHISNVRGKISGSGSYSLARIDNTLAVGTRKIFIADSHVDGLTFTAGSTYGMIESGVAITNTNIRTDSSQLFFISGATPNVSYGSRFRLTQSSATNVTNFLGGHEGKEIFIYFGDGNSTIKNTNIYTQGAADWTATTSDMWHAVYLDGAWREVSRSGN